MNQPGGAVLQKFLWPRQTMQYVDEGAQLVGGPVVQAADVARIQDPAELIAAYGLTGLQPYGPAPEFVDVLRFATTPLMRLERPQAGPERPWPTYANGFLPAQEAVPVWRLALTRVPAGAEVWRLRRGEQRPLLVFAGPAVGWRNGRAWAPAPELVGPRVEWQGSEYVAAFGADDPTWMELVAYGDIPEGFEAARPQVSHRMVPRVDCDRVFEVELTAKLQGIPCRVLRRSGDQAHVLLLTDDPDAATAVGATASEPGLFEVTVRTAELTDGGGSAYELGLTG